METDTEGKTAICVLIDQGDFPQGMREAVIGVQTTTIPSGKRGKKRMFRVDKREGNYILLKAWTLLFNDGFAIDEQFPKLNLS